MTCDPPVSGAGDHPAAPTFSCRRCGECCRWPGHVLLTEADIRLLARRLDIDESVFIDRYARLASNRAQLSLSETPDGACVFLDGSNCRVYDARPEQCRGFPATWTVAGCPAQSPRPIRPRESV